MNVDTAPAIVGQETEPQSETPQQPSAEPASAESTSPSTPTKSLAERVAEARGPEERMALLAEIEQLESVPTPDPDPKQPTPKIEANLPDQPKPTEPDIDPETKLPRRVYTGHLTDEKRRFLDYLSRNPDVDLPDAVAKFIPPTPPPDPDQQFDPEMPSNLEDIDKDIVAMRTERQEALEKEDLKRFGQLTDAIESASEFRRALQETQRTEQQLALEEFSKATQSHLDRAFALYPELEEDDSPITQRAQEIDAELARAGDPIRTRPDYLLYLAHEAAMDSQTAPKFARQAPAPTLVTPQSPSTTPPTTPARAPVAPLQPGPAPGSARTELSPNQGRIVADEILKAKGREQLLAVAAKLGVNLGDY